MTTMPDQRLTSTSEWTTAEPIAKAAEQYEIYAQLTRLAREAAGSGSPFPEFYAPLPAPLTLSPR